MIRTKKGEAMNWKTMAEGREKYQAYLASREWSVLKEAVKKRAGGYCERCHVNPLDHVHHLTYARKYAERLEDLQAQCKACHEFTHDKSSYDPKKMLRKQPLWVGDKRVRSVYLAGKITGDSWRDDFVRGWSREQSNSRYRAMSDIKIPDFNDDGLVFPPSLWGDVEECVETPLGPWLDYVGPWWIGDEVCCGHSVAEDQCSPHASGGVNEAHGFSTLRDSAKHLLQRAVARTAVQAIARSDLVFAWFSSLTAYGSLVEVGLARGMNKLVVIASDERAALDDDLWFCDEMGHALYAQNAKEGWDLFWMNDGKLRPA